MRVWIGIHLPHLALDSLRPLWTQDEGGLVVIERDRVLAASAAALAAGVRPGMRRSSVLSLAPGAAIRERDDECERQRLHATATALLRFSPLVVLSSEATVLVEVAASLRLFGGIRRLLRMLRETLRALALTCRLGLAPTSAGAWLMARIGRRILQLDSLRRRIDALPFSLLPEARPLADWLDGLGCRTCGDLLRLPRAGLKRRAGATLVDALDRALGNEAELHEWFDVPPVFDVRQELPDRTEHAEPIAACAEGMVMQLVGWLNVKHYAVTRLALELVHERGRQALAPTLIEIALGQPTRETAHLSRLLRERIARTVLPAAVLGVRLRVLTLEPAAPPSETLFPAPGGSPADHLRLLELVIARVGANGIRRPTPLADHRPDVANCWSPHPIAKPPQPAAHLTRPIWLLLQPVPLLVRQHRPFYGSPLRLVSTGERIETGWWSGQTMSRDYFVAVGSDQIHYWIYRERPSALDEAEPRWFLHGLFG
ncbi:Y-family DNA polymerase [Chitinasiproducens palmae]|uniref:Protein ImuB n=1 Tax=Chitinasiproducens palmae TaxID=1770053 RepID=A0A1H2PPH6_9BURK|nr:DNA polymerase Y family protein [Chitinasiproducens palmae]SDV48650.1 protein ImuB [Chitinasiproducens palmae]